MPHKTDRLAAIPDNDSNIVDLNTRLIHLIQQYPEIVQETDFDELLILEQNLQHLLTLVQDTTSMKTQCTRSEDRQIAALHIRSATRIPVDSIIREHNLLLNKERPLFFSFARDGLSLAMQWFERDDGKLQRAKLKFGTTYQIGRLAPAALNDAVIRIQEASISRMHASLRIEPDVITVDDIGSSFGTFLVKKQDSAKKRSYDEWLTLWQITFAEYSVIEIQPFGVSIPLNSFCELLFEQPGTMLSGNFDQLRETEEKLKLQVDFFESLFV